MVKKVQHYKQIYFRPVYKWGLLSEGTKKYIIPSFNFDFKVIPTNNFK